MQEEKAFGIASAVMLGIGSMVGAGIFIVIGEAGAIAGNGVWISFIFGALAALASGYSLARLALRYPSRGGIVEYLVQGYGEGIFSGSMSVLFYISQLVVVAAVSKSFGTYAATFMQHGSPMWIDLFAIGIVILFVLINLIGASMIAKSENIIVAIKVTVLVLFAIIALFTIKAENLSFAAMPPISSTFFAIGLTFFAYQGFSVITNTVEDMKDPKKTMLRSMIITILLVAGLYILTSISVLGNLSLDEVIRTRDYALAEAAKPVFGEWGFKIMAATAMLATASAINATLYATTEIGYTMAKEGELPKHYSYNIFHSYEGLIISAILIVPMILFFDLSQVTTVAAVSVLIIQGVTHIGHLRKIRETGANLWIVTAAVLSMFAVAGLTLYYILHHSPEVIYFLGGAFGLAFVAELLLRAITRRVISRQTDSLSTHGH